MIKVCIVIGVFFIAGLIYYLFPIIEVCGISMFPTYKDGEFIVGTRLFRKKHIKAGDVVMFHPPNDKRRVVIKRVVEIHQYPPLMYCVGDNAEESYDSRNYGFVNLDRLVCIPIKQRNKSRKEGSSDE